MESTEINLSFALDSICIRIRPHSDQKNFLLFTLRLSMKLKQQVLLFNGQCYILIDKSTANEIALQTDIHFVILIMKRLK